ncbi:MAG TPA: DUF3515 domain-containing protein [Marmoricola sp.]|nr:DUF3515 domain-containing protein [Marmoricola sp.]
MPRRPHLTSAAVRRPLPLRVAGVALPTRLPTRRGSRLARLLAGLLVMALAGCGSNTVDVARFPVDAAARRECPDLVKALPGHVSDQARRRVAGSPYAAAWGDPPIILRCGVGRPHGFDRFSTCQTANGIDWYVPPSDYPEHADVLMTTVYREPAVEVHLPAGYRPPVNAMVDLTRTIKQHTRATGHCR